MTPQEAYIAGFVKLCEDNGVDPQELVKFSQKAETAPAGSGKPASPQLSQGAAPGNLAGQAGGQQNMRFNPGQISSLTSKVDFSKKPSLGTGFRMTPGGGAAEAFKKYNPLSMSMRGAESMGKGLGKGLKSLGKRFFGGAKATGRSVQASADYAYGLGFVKYCEDNDIDVEALLKLAKVMAKAPTAAEKADFASKVKGKKDPLSKMTSSGIKGKKGPIAKGQNMRKEMLGD